MARVNHRRIKELIVEKRKTITDKMFFSSRSLATHFADIARAQASRYKMKRRIRVRLEWNPSSPDAAYTLYNLIWINAGFKFVTAHKSRLERYEIVAGLFTHELGHVFYTPFLMYQTHGNFFKEGKWYPEKPRHTTTEERANEKAMWKYCKDNPDKLGAMQNVLHNLANIVEDGIVENMMLDRYPGVLGHGLQKLCDVQFGMMDTLSEMIEKERDGDRHIWATISQLILSYVKFGAFKYGEEPMTDERLQLLFPMLSDLDKALTSEDPKDRVRVVNSIVIRCWPYISDFLDHCEADASAAGSGSSIGGIVATVLSGLAGSSKGAQGDTTPLSDGKGAPGLSSGANRAETKKQAAGEEGPEEPEDAEDEEKNEEPPVPEEPAAEEEGENPPPGNMDKNPFDEGSITQEVGSAEQGRIPYHKTDQLYEPTGGETERDDDYEGAGYTHAAEDIQRILEDMAEKEAFKELETERSLALNALAQSISYGDIHSGCSFKVHRMVEPTDEMVEDYRETAPELLHISQLLKRSILQQLQDKQKGGKLTNLMMGRKLDAGHLHRKNGRPFYKTTLPNDKPEMAVALLLDESGSMCSCDRATYARASAIILYDFCRSLNIPVMVYGHSTGHGGVDLYSYAEFDAIDRDDCFRMMDISARSSNRDGAALRFVAEQLVKRPEDFKMLILVSDGQPADWGYSGTAAEEDLRGIKQEYKRKGITFIAAAIGDDKENIKRIYGDSFLDITDLNKLPVKLTEVVKRNLRV